jgi:GNAT superfamily N-acetyltransferase
LPRDPQDVVLRLPGIRSDAHYALRDPPVRSRRYGFEPPTPHPADIPTIGAVVHRAFRSIADRHNFPHDFPSVDAATGLAQMFVTHPAIFGVAAEVDGQIVGSNFLDLRDPIAGVGPITVDPASQSRGVGRRLMTAVLEHGRSTNVPGIRLVQDAFNTASMSLYASLGFDAREPLALMTGRVSVNAAAPPPPGSEIRPMADADLPACADLCRRVHAFDRTGELRDAIKMFGPLVLTRGGEVVAYASAPRFWPLNHGVAATEQDLRDLLAGASARADEPLALLVPIRRTDLFRWCLANGLRTVKPMTLMSIGDYREPARAFYPSVSY